MTTRSKLSYIWVSCVYLDNPNECTQSILNKGGRIILTGFDLMLHVSTIIWVRNIIFITILCSGIIAWYSILLPYIIPFMATRWAHSKMPVTGVGQIRIWTQGLDTKFAKNNGKLQNPCQGFRKCLFNIITFQICWYIYIYIYIYILHTIYLSIRYFIADGIRQG